MLHMFMHQGLKQSSNKGNCRKSLKQKINCGEKVTLQNLVAGAHPSVRGESNRRSGSRRDLQCLYHKSIVQVGNEMVE